ncbi:battenin-like isoform X1 [Montipora capricornis]|uniref:battenin-like isoform X1 n=1 Tax=Montipora capricornis TaxID=246305 RepID=UPI0035F17375
MEDVEDLPYSPGEVKVKTKTILAFGTIGFLVAMFFYVNLSAGQDILQGTVIPTPFVLLSATGPACLSSMLYPYIFQKIPVPVASCVILVLSVAGMLATSIMQEPRMKLIGVCVVSFGYGTLESVFSPLSALYGKAMVDSFTTGTGVGSFLAPLSYLGLTMLACLSPEVSYLLIAVLWILFPIAYLAMDDLSNRIHEKFHPTSFTEVPYKQVESNTNDELPSKLSCVEMSWLVWETLVPFLALFSSNFSKQLLVNSVATTLAFSNTSVAPRNQYIFYMLALGTGDVLGRSYLGLLSLCGIEKKFTTRKTWILAFANVSLVIVMVFVSWFRLFSHFYAVYAVVLVNSFLAGACFVNSFHNAGEGLGVLKVRFCRALLIGALWSANTAVSLIGINTEVLLRQHCLAFLTEVVCYTRSLNGWNPSEYCVT